MQIPPSTAIQQHQHFRRGDEYWDDICRHMHEMERYTMGSTQSMDQQPEIHWDMRPFLIDFLVEIHLSFRLRPESLYLALNIVDCYVSGRIILIKHYQLVGCAVLWIAAKFEDSKERIPTVQSLAQKCHSVYEESVFIQMEGHVLSTIQWMLGHPTAEVWLGLISCLEEAKVQHVAHFLMEITLYYRDFVKYMPSSIALAALALAHLLCGKPAKLWEETDEVLEIVDLLDMRVKRIDNLSKMLVKKYLYVFYSTAAVFVRQYYLQK
ncbi:cyclin-like protein [Rhodocollybia butyracea]|uniref:Cyclin-like protein n=1 Tax=Rhodocollybia butyracea TaxID=206335 RepID=A0A9P5TWA1_9AGAR|nr:cyclin-like protein [Rhodocollybia butyracea]